MQAIDSLRESQRILAAHSVRLRDLEAQSRSFSFSVHIVKQLSVFCVLINLYPASSVVDS